MWEIFFLGASQPTRMFPHTFDVLVMSLRLGKRMAKPDNAPPRMYDFTDTISLFSLPFRCVTNLIFYIFCLNETLYMM